MDQAKRETAALLTLLRERPRSMSWGQIAAEVSYEGSALAVLTPSNDDGLFDVPFDEARLTAEYEAVESWRRAGLAFVTVLDEDYPRRLRGIRETPPFLFYEGALVPDDEGMSVVGSRDATRWGLDFAADAAQLLVSEGMTVIGGLAAGVDTAAHRAALDAGGRTVAFLGTGITKSYPQQNTALQREIAARGLVLSQFYPDAPPTKQTFPMRNASMSGYGAATIVVEANEHSGTRIQARLAGEHGRPVVLTSRVVETTDWGKETARRPNVWVVHNTEDLTHAVREIREAPRRLENALAALAAG
ncbi:hypothetical protein GCM10023221_32860 [Luteimicrobium xylanilyticum]|uniref:Protein smf n=1 Tax=Luteimicrobium xylanilyticum TaxID=1133546 RepID=A0A5P9QBQ0_9MICO|nr:DNA-processing protein DprA [Luteimicrobium xylanilyticum]QFU98502.1 Protein smf [Luteimicrobium xylanilyticum]